MAWLPFIGSFGLGLDIIGVIILSRTGLPSKTIRKTGYVQQFDEKLANKYDRWSAIAIFLIVIGFLFQIAGNLLCDYAALC